MAKKSQPEVAVRKFRAPEHVSGVHTFAGERRCDKNGVLEVPEDASEAEVDLIIKAGFKPIDGDAPAAPAEQPPVEEPPVE